MSYLKYLSDDTRGFFSHGGKILGICAVLLVLLKLIFDIRLTWGEMGLTLLGGAGSLILIWLLYALIEYPHYRKLKLWPT